NFGTRGGGNNIIDASVNIGTLGQGLNLGVINGTINIPGLGIISNIGLLVRALSTDANANILSTPTLLTLDNEEARVMVGSNVPFITGQYATTGSTSTVEPFQTIERHDVGLLLRVKPQITEGGAVRMVLYQEVSRVGQGPSTDAAGPPWTKRSLLSPVVVDDQHTLALGAVLRAMLTAARSGCDAEPCPSGQVAGAPNSSSSRRCLPPPPSLQRSIPRSSRAFRTRSHKRMVCSRGETKANPLSFCCALMRPSTASQK